MRASYWSPGWHQHFGVSPWKNFTFIGLGGEHSSWQASNRVSFSLLSFSNLFLNSPVHDLDDTWWGKDAFSRLVLVGAGELAGQSIQLDVLRPWTIGNGEVDPCKEEGPLNLMGVESCWRYSRFSRSQHLPASPSTLPRKVWSPGVVSTHWTQTQLLGSRRRNVGWMWIC